MPEAKDLGAFGLIGGKTACLVTFYSDLDANMDGKVSWTEWTFGMNNGSQLALLAQCAPSNRDLLRRCRDLPEVQQETLAAFAGALLMDGFYKAYFMRGVGAVGGAVANKITLNMVHNLFIRKGMETSVKAIMGTAKMAGTHLNK
jgi:hypothetical protein